MRLVQANVLGRVAGVGCGAQEGLVTQGQCRCLPARPPEQGHPELAKDPAFQPKRGILPSSFLLRTVPPRMHKSLLYLGRSDLVGGHQADSHGVQRRLGPALGAKLAQHVADVGLDGATADAEPYGNLLVGNPSATSLRTSFSRSVSASGGPVGRAAPRISFSAAWGDRCTRPGAAARMAAFSSSPRMSLTR